jgi:hypothetical protein
VTQSAAPQRCRVGIRRGRLAEAGFGERALDSEGEG